MLPIHQELWILSYRRQRHFVVAANANRAENLLNWPGHPTAGENSGHLGPYLCQHKVSPRIKAEIIIKMEGSFSSFTFELTNFA
ncbi:hypothetical protein A0J57_18235 [Sphingobium sp. 22B]|nr:hypothetical protein AXW74_24195 [Sphingobium sp. AM]KYC30931.1 hypothetical protein A0J57_18235 [Sphingobium sp. 22B]OAP30463.1 hypothetical protein A8O16_18525 [Sphingobium sp. 20006FA]